MLQVVQDIRSGVTSVRSLPDPIAPAGHVVVANAASLVSAGTERYVVELARKSLLEKARDRPDHVRRVLQKLKQEGVLSTARQVIAKLDEPMPLGYSTAGIVLEAGRGVQELKPGDRVACSAPHAGVVAVGKNLCAKIPDKVSFADAAYGGVGAIALQGVRLARVELGERVLVIGLGLIGLITVALLRAQGCRVIATDIDPSRASLAREFGADEVIGEGALEAIAAFTRGQGVDATIITAATESNGPIELAAEACRMKGRIVLVGVAGLNVPRPPFFKKELEFTVSSSMGAGRNDPSYEESGIDYPIGYARWTVQRNMEAFLDAVSSGAVPVHKLTTHTMPIARAAEAYDLITTRKEPFIGIVLEYPPTERPTRRIELRAAKPTSKIGLSLVGVGNFARLVLLPALSGEKGVELRGLASARGLNALHSGSRLGFSFATTDFAELTKDSGTNALFIATRHDLHAEQVIGAIEAGKNVFVEKPLCIRADELTRIEQALERAGARAPLVMVGFNRRFSKAVAMIREHMRGAAPLTVSFRFCAGELPPETWPQNEDIGGGRIVGEACHAIDTCTAIVGSPPVRVFAESTAKVGAAMTSDDRVFITLRHANGAISNISYQAGNDRAGPKERIEVFGGGRTIIVDDFDLVQLWRGNKMTEKRAGKDKGHAAEIARFFEACRGGQAPIPWSEIHAVTWASLAAVASLRTGLAIDAESALDV